MRALAAALVLLGLAPALALGLGPAAFPANVQVTTSNGPANEVHIAVNPTDPLNLVAGAKDYTLGPSPDCGQYRVWTGVYSSHDGGATWTNGLLPGYPGGPQSPLTGYRCSSDPAIAFGSDGTAYFVGLSYNGPDGNSLIWLAASKDGGVTWPTITKVFEAPGSGGLFANDKEWVTVDPLTNIAYVTWTLFNFQGSQIYMARCALAATVCTPPQMISLPAEPLVQGSAPAVGLGGTVYVVWNDYYLGQLMFTRCLAGAVCSPAVPIASERLLGRLPNSHFRSPTMPSLAVVPGAPDTLVAAWSDARRDSSDVAFVRSANGGATWSSVAFLNHDAAGSSNFFPALSAAPDGRLDATWYDRRDDPNNFLLTAYLGSSTDGGANWTNERVGSAQFDGDLGYHQTGAPFIGDYLGVASTNDHAYPLWADTRTGSSQVFVGLVPR